MKDLDANLIIANAPDPVFVSDLRGKILLANEAVSQLLGFREDEVLEQSLSRFVSLGEASELMVALREVVERGVTRNIRSIPVVPLAKEFQPPSMPQLCAARMIGSSESSASCAICESSIRPERTQKA